MKTYRITEFKVSDFIAKMDKFTKRANRLGIEFGYKLESESMGEYVKRDTLGELMTYTYKVYNYSVYGESPVVNGYSFLAKIEPFENVNLIHSHSDLDLSQYKTATLTCEHCHINRNRNFYFLVMNETSKEVKMLGGNCLAQYIAQPNAEDIAE